MAYTYITTQSTTQCYTGKVPKVHITINQALTGTIKVIDGTSGSTANVASIVNPTVGSSYEYYDLQTGCRIDTSASCDITVNTNLRHDGR